MHGYVSLFNQINLKLCSQNTGLVTGNAKNIQFAIAKKWFKISKNYFLSEIIFQELQ